jgi:hypothetical protein
MQSPREVKRRSWSATWGWDNISTLPCVLTRELNARYVEYTEVYLCYTPSIKPTASDEMLWCLLLLILSAFASSTCVQGGTERRQQVKNGVLLITFALLATCPPYSGSNILLSALDERSRQTAFFSSWNTFNPTLKPSVLYLHLAMNIANAYIKDDIYCQSWSLAK